MDHDCASLTLELLKLLAPSAVLSYQVSAVKKLICRQDKDTINESFVIVENSRSFNDDPEYRNHVIDLKRRFYNAGLL